MNCVGFVECPCGRCVKRRRVVTGAHPFHVERLSPYCGICRTWLRLQRET